MPERKSAYQVALEKWEVALEQALALIKDPFKAPELNVYESRNVLNAAWELQIEFTAMELAGRRERGEE